MYWEMTRWNTWSKYIFFLKRSCTVLKYFLKRVQGFLHNLMKINSLSYIDFNLLSGSAKHCSYKHLSVFHIPILRISRVHGFKSFKTISVFFYTEL